ncbi:MAG: tetratricopeptide repeat protein, partial [Acidobacteria bacterium]|nr:tetratricopeptide repeat protein [Acidobacteriota bacterium]
QYLHIADMYARQNKTRECAEALEKVVELDPMNSAVQLRLAEIYVREGNSQQARQHLNGAGRALAKAGDHRAAVDVYRRALDMDGRNTESLRGFLDAAQQLGDAQLVQQQLSVALEQIPDDVDVRELAGRAFLSAHDTESALRHFEFVLAADPLRYENYILVSNHLLEAGDFDGASASLDPILPIAISRREPAPLIQACDLILAQAPEHVPTLRKLAEVSSALNDGIRYLDALERQADVHARQGNAAGALECLAKILEFSPDSKEHRNMHREMFAKAYPDQPYIPPVQHDSPASLEPHTHAEGAAGAGVEEEGATNPALIEIDLLLNYGMKEKARLQLQELIGVDPYDRHARLRLFTIHKEAGESREAAEQALLLAALHERAGKEAAAGRHLAEAKKLDPDRVGARFDLASFAEQHGIAMAEVKARAHTVPAGSATALELDLSGDLTEIFFQDSAGELAIDEVESDATEAAGLTDEIGAGISKPPRPALSEQLQEVDFYIRLGFADEAKAKLSEIARDYPDHPELEPRYQKLDAGVPPSPDDRPAGSLGGLDAVRPEPVGGDDIGALWESDALSFDPQEPPVIALGAQSGEAEVQTAAAAAAESQSQ